MPRRPRLSLPGIPWHIIQRGNNRAVCFYSEDDYFFYLRYLAENATRFGCVVHAYVLMTNHVHLLLTPEKADSASLLMKHLGQRYVQYVNRTHRRSGTLWEGRFRSCLIQAEDYLLACYRYIELNPVRAGMVRHPRDYRWSSYITNAEGIPNRLIRPHDQYLCLAQSNTQRRIAYRDLFKTDLDADVLSQIRDSTNGNFVLGAERFQKEIESTLNQRATRGKAGRPPKASEGKKEQLGLL
ncbi:transposase [Nitrosospira sp. NRS527]|uniref:transposase n=1 Tax=Nitrosospira sp. NRS527 TaxID=155925 RepID=UPI001AF9AAE9|nr:transposase [Nitrosospira sp. NRS527]BCT66559.1 hypothetical protein NNRS527_00123 [Nitrosospira sp. NRS527]